VPIRRYHVYRSIPDFGWIDVHQFGTAPQGRGVYVHDINMPAFLFLEKLLRTNKRRKRRKEFDS